MGLSDFKFERLSATSDLNGFNCGDEDLNDFLVSDAINYQTELLAVSYLLVNSDSGLSAFFSVSRADQE